MGNPVKVRLKKWSVQGEPRWVVEWTLAGKRTRRYFSGKKQAEAEKANVEEQFTGSGDVWMGLTAAERGEILAVWDEVRAKGLTLRDVWEEYKRRPVTVAPVRKPLRIAIEEVIQAKLQAKRRQRYVDSLEAYLEKFATGREQLSVDQITSTEIEQWFANRKEAPQTQASNLGRLSALFSFCVRKGYCLKNPCDSVERVSADRRPPPILTVKEAKRLLFTCRCKVPKLLPYLALGLLAGVRPEEMEQHPPGDAQVPAPLTWGDVNLTKGRVRIEKTKVRWMRIVELHPAAVAWLEVCTPGKRTDPICPRKTTLRRLRRKLRDLCGLGQWHQDILRHTAASHLLALYQDAPKVALMLGTSVPMLLKHYRGLVDAEEARDFWSFLPRPSAPRVSRARSVDGTGKRAGSA